MRRSCWVLLCVLVCGLGRAAEGDFLRDVRQLTFTGKTGEGYFSPDGTKLIFQSTREAGNPFYQIYILDLETGGDAPGVAG